MIAIASDHAGFTLKQILVDECKKTGSTLDMGVESDALSVDYPDFAVLVANKVVTEGARGVLICGSGIGMSIAANKVRGVRAALCRSVEDARLSREHNDANILVLGARVTDENTAKEILHTWLKTPFAGGRHQNRVDKLMKL